jgi:hypothetical protein
MSKIHCLFYSDVGHMYIAERGDLRHYQEVFSNFVLALEWFDDRMPVYLYMRGEDYSNHFMLVRNLARVVQPFVDRMDWMEIHRSLFCPKKKAEKPAGIGKQRQDECHDLGFCCGVSLTRDGTSGVAEPRMKTGTMQNATVLDGYAVLTESIVTTPVKWTEGNDRLFQDADNPDRQEKIASKIQKDNVLECMRSWCTNLDSKCGCHHDWNNSFHRLCQAFVGMSKVMNVGGKDVRIGINAQGRKSIDDYLSRSNQYPPLLQMVLSEYKRMPNICRVVLEALFNGTGVGGTHGFCCLKNPCNMEPMSYHQPFLHYAMHLIKRFGLTFPETVGVMSAMEVLPNTAYYFSAAVEALLLMRTSDLSLCHRGFAFGYLVAKLLLHHRRINSGHCPGTRFNIYWDPELPSSTKWKDRYTLKTLACLRFHAAFPTLVNKKKRVIEYKKLQQHFAVQPRIAICW